MLIDNLEISADIVNTDQKERAQIHVDPNPFSDYLLIQNDSHLDFSNYRIVTAFGQTVKNGTLMAKSTEVGVGDLPSGAYFIQFYNSKGFIGNMKLIKP